MTREVPTARVKEPVAARGPMAGRTWLLFGPAVAALIWVFHDLSWREFVLQLTRMDKWWIIPAIAADILSYWCQGLRWQLLLRPAGRLSALRLMQAIFVGLFTNEILPMRLGEAVAAFLVGRWLECPVARVVPSMVVGRLLDGAWLACAIGVLVMYAPLPKDLAWAGDVFGALVALGVALFVLILLRRTPTQGDENDARLAPGNSPIGRRKHAARWVAAVIRGYGRFVIRAQLHAQPSSRRAFCSSKRWRSGLS